MTRELILLSPDPVTVQQWVAAAAAVDPDLELAELWAGGGWQFHRGEQLALAVLRSSPIGLPAEAARLLGAAVTPRHRFWSETTAPYGAGIADRLLAAMARATGGAVYEMGASS